MNVIILPHQLFRKQYLSKKNTYYIWEHPHYFESYKYNKKKLILHKASLLYYHDYLKKTNYKTIYVEIDKDPPTDKEYIMFDPIDKLKFSKKNIHFVESPNFLLEKTHYEAYRQKTKKFTFNNFYMWGKKELNIIPDIKSQDSKNRKRAPKDITYPKLPSISKTDKKWINKAIPWVMKNYPNNYGNCDNFFYPVTHVTSKKWLNDFIQQRLNDFGPYQDFIDSSSFTGFHSILSAVINIGLLQPKEIITIIMKIQKKVKIESFEGYIRQLFWREYQRYCYIYFEFPKQNYFKVKTSLNKKWYDGTLNVPPLDDLIQSGFDTGYIHHIGRLMFIGNYMNLIGMKPDDGFKWFMEFSCDSYLWVMYQNVYEMVFFVSGGATMRKPYFSSSNYILKMSNYKKGEWCEVWDKAFKAFIKTNRKKLLKFRYAYPFIK